MRKAIKVILSIEVILFMVMAAFLGLYTNGALADGAGGREAFEQAFRQAETQEARLVANEYFRRF